MSVEAQRFVSFVYVKVLLGHAWPGKQHHCGEVDITENTREAKGDGCQALCLLGKIIGFVGFGVGSFLEETETE